MGDATPDYCKAIELRRGMAVLEEGLRGLDGRVSFGQKRAQQMTNVFFVIEVGNIPLSKPKGFAVPTPGRN